MRKISHGSVVGATGEKKADLVRSSDPRTWVLAAPTIDPTSSWLLPRSTAIGWLNEEDTMSSRHLSYHIKFPDLMLIISNLDLIRSKLDLVRPRQNQDLVKSENLTLIKKEYRETTNVKMILSMY